MTSKMEAANGPAAPAIQELAMLQGLKELLALANRALGHGEPETLLDVSLGINLRANDLMTISLMLNRLPISAEAQQQRQDLLAELRQQCFFCHAMLRRWRRFILLRHLLPALQGEPLPYTEVLGGRWC